MRTRVIRYAMFFFICFIGSYFFIEERNFFNTLKISILFLLVDILVDVLFQIKKFSAC